MNSADIPLAILPAGSRLMRQASIVLATAAITCAPWAYMLYDERAAHEQQLAEAIGAPLRLSQPRMLTIEYDDGAKVKIAITQSNLGESK